MSDKYGIDLSKLRKIKITLKNGLETEHLCIDHGEGVWREKDDLFQAHTIRLVRSANGPYKPKWQDIVSKEYYTTHEISEFLPISES